MHVPFTRTVSGILALSLLAAVPVRAEKVPVVDIDEYNFWNAPEKQRDNMLRHAIQLATLLPKGPVSDDRDADNYLSPWTFQSAFADRKVQRALGEPETMSLSHVSQHMDVWHFRIHG